VTTEDYSTVLDLWVKYPPIGTFPLEGLKKLPALYTTEMDTEIPVESRLLLIMRRSQFEKSKNPVFAIEAFLVAREAKLFPPLWVLDWLGESFKKFHAAQGKQSLEKIMGLVPGRGQTPLFKALFDEERDEMLALDVFRLTTLFKISIEDAASMAARRLEALPNWNKTAYRLNSISEETVRDRYKRKWKKVFDTPEGRQRLLRIWTKKQADEYLKMFPRDSYESLNLCSSFTR
jgi:hypothetical protein